MTQGVRMATLSSQHSQLLPLLSSFSTKNPSPLQSTLDGLSHELVSDKSLRIQLGSQSPSIWMPLYELWGSVTRAQSAGTDLDSQQTRLVLSLAKFTRNLVADVPLNQKNAFALEPQIRQLIYLLTAWTKDENESFATTRMLTQTLSNLVTGNQELLDQFWSVHMEIPEEQSVLIRLLGLPDLRTVLSVLVLIMNCIHDSSERGHTLVTTSIGIRVCVLILDRLEGPKDLPELEDETEVFELGYAIFSKLFQFGYFPELYKRTFIDDEPVSPTQTTLLKLLDSFLNSVPTPFRGRDDHRNNLAGLLASVFLLQAKHVQDAIQHATGERSPGQNAATNVRGGGGTPIQAASRALDGRLPGVWVVLVLLSTCLSSILLAEQEDYGGVSTDPGGVTSSHLCHDTISAMRSGTGSGFIEDLLETLRLLHDFLPRINFGKVKLSPKGRQGVPGHAPDAADFPYLKRDLVRLLGILCHNCRAIQDRVRLCGGIPVVLNLCAIDDRNPYLREYALFALRNLLHNNSENQAVVNTFQPTNTWDLM
ncbi:spinocerebellar ataxia type 10 protein domain-containing protein [Russula vinacea]|nr:spinocerebellar ataxia type 10 protein domain-containing protein [Russula vinacea]